MIFVTVGTTKFDELIETMDRIAPSLEEEVIMQIGTHKFVPINCKYFDFDNELTHHFKRANIVIAHGGAGITFEVLGLNKKLISIDNPHVIDGHQVDLLNKLSKEGYLIWCRDLSKIENYIKAARKMEIKKYVRPACDIAKIIIERTR